MPAPRDGLYVFQGLCDITEGLIDLQAALPPPLATRLQIWIARLDAVIDAYVEQPEADIMGRYKRGCKALGADYEDAMGTHRTSHAHPSCLLCAALTPQAGESFHAHWQRLETVFDLYCRCGTSGCCHAVTHPHGQDETHCAAFRPETDTPSLTLPQEQMCLTADQMAQVLGEDAHG
jgi:hypothetical protein